MEQGPNHVAASCCKEIQEKQSPLVKWPRFLWEDETMGSFKARTTAYHFCIPEPHTAPAYSGCTIHVF